MSPKHNEDKTEEHSSEVCKMSYVVSSRTGYTSEKLKDAIKYYQPFGFDRNWGKQQDKTCIWKHHAECQQNAKNCARCPHSDEVVEVWVMVQEFSVGDSCVRMKSINLLNHIRNFPSPCKLLDNGRTHTGDQLVDDETSATPC